MITLIYALRDGHWIRYVGKTCNSLEYRLSKHLYYARAGENTYKGRGIRKMLREGRLPRITLLEVVEGNGKKEENDQIAYFRSYGIKLWNSTEGGEGNCLVASVRRKIGKANEGRIHNEVSRKNMSDGHIGQVAWNKNKRDIYSEKSLLKMKESHTGVKLPRERVEKSRAGIIRAWTPAKKEKARVTALNRHYVPTKETLEKMRSAAIKREALKKKNGFVGYWKGKKMPPHKENCKCAGCMSKRGTPYRRKTYRS